MTTKSSLLRLSVAIAAVIFSTVVARAAASTGSSVRCVSLRSRPMRATVVSRPPPASRSRFAAFSCSALPPREPRLRCLGSSSSSPPPLASSRRGDLRPPPPSSLMMRRVVASASCWPTSWPNFRFSACSTMSAQSRGAASARWRRLRARPAARVKRCSRISTHLAELITPHVARAKSEKPKSSPRPPAGWPQAMT